MFVGTFNLSTLLSIYSANCREFFFERRIYCDSFSLNALAKLFSCTNAKYLPGPKLVDSLAVEFFFNYDVVIIMFSDHRQRIAWEKLYQGSEGYPADTQLLTCDHLTNAFEIGEEAIRVRRLYPDVAKVLVVQGFPSEKNWFAYSHLVSKGNADFDVVSCGAALSFFRHKTWMIFPISLILHFANAPIRTVFRIRTTVVGGLKYLLDKKFRQFCSQLVNHD